MWGKDTRFPLPDDHFRPVRLEDEEKQEYLDHARALVPRLVEMTESEAGWQFAKESNGIRIWQRSEASTSSSSSGGIHLFRSVTEPFRVDVSDGFSDMLLMDSTDKLRALYRDFDPTFLDGQLLSTIYCDREKSTLCTIKWCAFKTPPVTWDRDFVFLDYVDPNFSDSAGRRCCVALVTSVSRPETPTLPKKYSCVRGEILISGYIVRELEPGLVEMHFVAQFDPKGWLPAWVVNVAAVDQSLNLARIRDWAIDFQANRSQQRAQGLLPPLSSASDGSPGSEASSPGGSRPLTSITTRIAKRIPFSLEDVVSALSGCLRVDVEACPVPVYGRLELSPAQGWLAAEDGIAGTPAIPNAPLMLVQSPIPLVLCLGPSQLSRLSAALADAREGHSITPKLGVRICMSLLCDVRRLRLAAAAKPRGHLRLIVFHPKSASHCFRGTWSNIVSFASMKFKDLAPVLRASLSSLEHTPFQQLEEEWVAQPDTPAGATFAAARSSPALFMSSRRLAHRRPSASLADVRLFFYCVFNLGSSFSGDGWVYDASGRRVSQEWFAQNVPLTPGSSCQVARLPCQTILAATTVVPSPGVPASPSAGPRSLQSAHSRPRGSSPPKRRGSRLSRAATGAAPATAMALSSRSARDVVPPLPISRAVSVTSTSKPTHTPPATSTSESKSSPVPAPAPAFTDLPSPASPPRTSAPFSSTRASAAARSLRESLDPSLTHRQPALHPSPIGDDGEVLRGVNGAPGLASRDVHPRPPPSPLLAPSSGPVAGSRRGGDGGVDEREVAAPGGYSATDDLISTPVSSFPMRTLSGSSRPPALPSPDDDEALETPESRRSVRSSPDKTTPAGSLPPSRGGVGPGSASGVPRDGARTGGRGGSSVRARGARGASSRRVTGSRPVAGATTDANATANSGSGSETIDGSPRSLGSVNRLRSRTEELRIVDGGDPDDAPAGTTPRTVHTLSGRYLSAEAALAETRIRAAVEGVVPSAGSNPAQVSGGKDSRSVRAASASSGCPKAAVDTASVGEKRTVTYVAAAAALTFWIVSKVRRP